MQADDNTSGGAHLLRIVWPFVLVVLALAFIGAASVEALSAARAVATAEGRWAAAQRAALTHLRQYTKGHDEAEFHAYEAIMAGPLGLRRARLALGQPDPDYIAAREGLIAGGSHPADVTGMIWLYRGLRHRETVGEAFRNWAAADEELARLHEQALRLQRRAGASECGEPCVAAVEHAIQRVEARLETTESGFADQLGAAARHGQALILGGNLGAAALLLAIATLVSRRMLRQQRHLREALARSEQAVAKRAASERRHAERQAYGESHDTLTGLLNRAEFERRLAVLLEEVQRTGGAHTLLYLDLDQFKVVNETCGRAVGDEMLRQLAGVMRTALRHGDTLARLGGDEFGVLLHHCDWPANERLAESLRSAVSEFRFTHRQRTFAVGISVGLIVLDRDIVRVDEALSAADAACHMAKDNGRNRVQVYRQHDTVVRLRHGEMEWVGRVHAAMASGRFCLYAQELVPLGTQGAGGRHVELLLRLVDEHDRLVAPAVFMPACERYNLMPMLDRWVVRTAFAELGRRAARQADNIAGKKADDIEVCAINLSGATLADSHFAAFVSECAAVHGVPLSQICFEITETAAIVNLSRAVAFIEALQAQGCTFALDDFGAGMSSFNYLKQLPATYLKIDGSFVRDMLTDAVNLVTIEMIQRIGHAMGMVTVAEFVESEAQLARLRALGVDFAQGNYLAPPVPFAMGDGVTMPAELLALAG